jgi:hypothetical protein
MVSLHTKHYSFAACPTCDSIEVTWSPDGKGNPLLRCEECERHWYPDERAVPCWMCDGKGKETCKGCDGTGLTQGCAACEPSRGTDHCNRSVEDWDEDGVGWLCRCYVCEGRHWRPWEQT